MNQDILHSQASGIAVLLIVALVTAPVWAALLITAIKGIHR